jgi:probable phosphoglycerate mutase
VEVALFSHGDPVRAVQFYYLGIRLDNWQRLELSPGSVSTFQVGAWEARVPALNLLFTR